MADEKEKEARAAANATANVANVDHARIALLIGQAFTLWQGAIALQAQADELRQRHREIIKQINHVTLDEGYGFYAIQEPPPSVPRDAFIAGLRERGRY